MAKYIFNNPEIRRILLWIALVIFVTLGIYFFYKAYRHQKFDSKNIRPSKFTTRHYWGGFLIALINVFPIPYFVMLSTLFKHPGGEYSWLSIILFALAASLGCLTTFYVYVISFLKIEKHTTKFSTYSNYFMGGLMTVLTVIALFRLFISS